MLPRMSDELTTGQVAERLGIKPGMVRRYAQALEAVTGVSLPSDGPRGRLYPRGAVGLLEAARGYLLSHPGESVEGALRAVTGQSDGGVTLPARVPGSVGPLELQEAFQGALAPILAELEQQRRENEALRQGSQEVLQELQGLRTQLARLEVTTHAALPAPVADQRAHPSSLLAAVIHWLTGSKGQ